MNTRHNVQPARLVGDTLKQGQGELSSTGALVIQTGRFTGRSPHDRYLVRDDLTRDPVDWGAINQPLDPTDYAQLYQITMAYAESLDQVFVRDVYACASPKYRLGVRVYTEYPWQSLFVHNMFLRLSDKERASFTPDWRVYAFPGVQANPEHHHTRQENFSVINFSEKTILIGGTAYTGEIKKGVFSVLNFWLPTQYGILPMHCSANVGGAGDTALFFGLSGTGKTTLSNDPDRRLIGDDEHGWSKESVFNFEGGCYAKTIDLSPTKEPQIYEAVRFGALLENVTFFPDSCTVNYADTSVTQNTRVSYPIYHISNIMYNSRGDIPENIFFLTCDAFGVLPPVSLLTRAQAMYHFLSGYTAKIAGTEEGVTEPQATFSSCFGAPFLPLAPLTYAQLLGEKIEQGQQLSGKRIHVWLINTGWTGGAYGEGTRLELTFTRAMVKAVLNGTLSEGEFRQQPVFNLSVPTRCPDVPNALLHPRDTWRNEEDYDRMARRLAQRFCDNFEQYAAQASSEVQAAGPTLPSEAF